jgi:hypothetical protein
MSAFDPKRMSVGCDRIEKIARIKFDVCLWHKADIQAWSGNVAFGGRADLEISGRDVCF